MGWKSLRKQKRIDPAGAPTDSRQSSSVRMPPAAPNSFQFSELDSPMGEKPSAARTYVDVSNWQVGCRADRSDKNTMRDAGIRRHIRSRRAEVQSMDNEERGERLPVHPALGRCAFSRLTYCSADPAAGAACSAATVRSTSVAWSDCPWPGRGGRLPEESSCGRCRAPAVRAAASPARRSSSHRSRVIPHCSC